MIGATIPGATHYLEGDIIIIMYTEKGEDDVRQWRWQECTVRLCMVSHQVRGVCCCQAM